MAQRVSLHLKAVEPIAHKDAEECFKRGNMEGFTNAAYSWGGTLAVVIDNTPALRERGLYEAALVHGFIGCKTNHNRWNLTFLEELFKDADRAKLIEATQPLPPNPPYVIYRGVSGKSTNRRIRGLSWTASLDVACKFALHGFEDPAVYQATVSERAVFCFTNHRHEQEFLVRPKQPTRMKLTVKQMQEAAQCWRDAQAAREKKEQKKQRKPKK